jgi:hypothetical protein
MVEMNHERHETAAKGKLIQETGDSYLVDFSKYAKKQWYYGDYSKVLVRKDKCLTVNEEI